MDEFKEHDSFVKPSLKRRLAKKKSKAKMDKIQRELDKKNNSVNATN